LSKKDFSREGGGERGKKSELTRTKLSQIFAPYSLTVRIVGTRDAASLSRSTGEKRSSERKFSASLPAEANGRVIYGSSQQIKWGRFAVLTRTPVRHTLTTRATFTYRREGAGRGEAERSPPPIAGRPKLNCKHRW